MSIWSLWVKGRNSKWTIDAAAGKGFQAIFFTGGEPLHGKQLLPHEQPRQEGSLNGISFSIAIWHKSGRMSAYFQGLLVGLTFAVLLGPGFFALVQTCIHSGFRAGVSLSIGIFLSDVFVLLLCFFGITQLLDVDPRNNVWFQIIGGMVLTILGIYTFNKQGVQAYPYQNQKLINLWELNHLYVIKGFFLNTLNPGIWLIWLTAIVSISARYGANNRSTGIYLAGILSTTLTADLLKCFVSHRIRNFCGAQTMTRVNHVIGIILIVFGIVMMFFRK